VLKVAISYDYDSPAGYRQSFHMQSFPMNADQLGTDAILRVLDGEGVKVTFGIVAVAATPGEPPEHCPDQVRAIHAAGHEIASHSMSHRWMPSMSDADLSGELVDSKAALEACVRACVIGFIPPFNRPMHFPGKLAFSVSERLGLHRRGRGRQSIPSLLRALRQTGYAWSRVSFSNKLHVVQRRLGLRANIPLFGPFVYEGVVAIPNHCCGFGQRAIELVRAHLGQDRALTLYAHPNQAYADNDEHHRHLRELIRTFALERRRGELAFCTMGELAIATRAAHVEAA
jgi:hypothetical protein